LVRQLLEHALHAVAGERVLVAGLRGREHEQGVEALVLDQGLLERGLALDDVDEVVHHAALAAHDQVEAAQPDVEVDDRDLLAAARQPAGQARAGGGLADAALAGRDYDDLGQSLSPVCASQSSAASFSWSPSSHTCTALPRSSAGMSSSTL